MLKKRGESKKAQLTMFMIIGIVVLLLFILMYIMVGAVKITVTKTETQEAFEAALTSQPTNQYEVL